MGNSLWTRGFGCGDWEGVWREGTEGTRGELKEGEARLFSVHRRTSMNYLTQKEPPLSLDFGLLSSAAVLGTLSSLPV